MQSKKRFVRWYNKPIASNSPVDSRSQHSIPLCFSSLPFFVSLSLSLALSPSRLLSFSISLCRAFCTVLLPLFYSNAFITFFFFFHGCFSLNSRISNTQFHTILLYKIYLANNKFYVHAVTTATTKKQRRRKKNSQNSQPLNAFEP